MSSKSPMYIRPEMTGSGLWGGTITLVLQMLEKLQIELNHYLSYGEAPMWRGKDGVIL